ncbi:sensor histidine kinase [Seleniivibrio woodruffii]|uniref:sensor histidine kinase n=1 Tax=Seleniivibrio woodruffii TaxID=1078050 RepID=UPI0039E31B9A
MMQYFPDILRSVTTDIMLVFLLWTMAMPKYKSRAVYIVATALIIAVNLSANYYFYLSEDYTSVFYVNLAMLLFIGIVMKPLFTDKIMQWCFSYITMLNIHAAIVFLSFTLSRAFPYPKYGHIVLRLILFSITIFVFHKWVSKLYRKVLDYWHIYMFPIVALFACFLSYFFGGDIKDTLINNYVQLLLLILLGLSVYVTIIHSLKTITKQYEMREENQSIQTEREYLQLAADGMSERLKLMEEVAAQNSRTAHDRRHFNNVLLELLEQGQTSEAATLLQSQNQSVPKIGRVFCENPAVNAAVCHYTAIAEQRGIPAEVTLDIPAALNVDALELSMVVSNLMENAIHSCESLPIGREPYIRFICRSAGRLLLEIENPCPEDTALDEEGYPIAGREGHGIGTKSVAAFAKKYDGEVVYRIENGIFRVRLLV